MPNPIKQFFEKKKAEAKFKMAGPGQKLGDTSQEVARRAQVLERLQNDASAAGPSRPKTVSAAQQQAAQAALSRWIFLFKTIVQRQKRLEKLFFKVGSESKCGF